MIVAIALMCSLQHSNFVHMKPVVIVTHTPTVYCHLYMSNSRFWLICLVYVCLNFDYTQMIILMQWGLAMLIGICDRIISHNWRFAFLTPNRFMNDTIYRHGSVPIWIKFQGIADPIPKRLFVEDSLKCHPRCLFFWFNSYKPHCINNMYWCIDMPYYWFNSIGYYWIDVTLLRIPFVDTWSN